MGTVENGILKEIELDEEWYYGYRKFYK
jgi:hypothetical protein